MHQLYLGKSNWLVLDSSHDCCYFHAAAVGHSSILLQTAAAARTEKSQTKRSRSSEYLHHASDPCLSMSTLCYASSISASFLICLSLLLPDAYRVQRAAAMTAARPALFLLEEIHDVWSLSGKGRCFFLRAWSLIANWPSRPCLECLPACLRLLHQVRQGTSRRTMKQDTA